MSRAREGYYKLIINFLTIINRTASPKSTVKGVAPPTYYGLQAIPRLTELFAAGVNKNARRGAFTTTNTRNASSRLKSELLFPGVPFWWECDKMIKE